MLRKFIAATGCAALVLSLFATDSDACFFRRGRGNAYPPVSRAPGPQSSGAAEPRTPEEILARMERLAETVNKPLAPLPKPSPAVEKVLSGPSK
jgi:hypothetical protein